jgi:hypothetical protein
MNTVIGIAVLLLYSFLAILYYVRPVWECIGYQRVKIPDGYERGQGLTEYALILVLIAIVVIGILTVLGPTVKGVF